MVRQSRSVLLVAAVSLVGGVLTAPGAAYAADTTTKLTATQMVVALEPATTATAAAAEDGWKAVITLAGDFSGSASYVVDPSRGIAYERFRFGELHDTAYAVAGKGMYRALSDLKSKAAVKMMGRPAVRYSFTRTPHSRRPST